MTKRKRSRLIFTVCLLVYAVLFLIGTAIGLGYLWDYMEAYERSRPVHAVDAYMDKLTADYICDKVTGLIAMTDSTVQSEENCRHVITEALSDKFTCVKNLGESTEEKTVYLIRCGSRIIGRFTIAPGEEIAYGFTPWHVISDSFDLSYLLTPGHTVTAPDNYTVTVNGTSLGADHIIKSGMQFPVLEEFYGTYSLPTLVTYQTGTTLGETEVVITDPEGTPVTIDENTDWNTLLPTCDEATSDKLVGSVSGFLKAYVDFTSCANNDTYGNHDRLQTYILPDTALSQRMKDAIAGLKWVSDRHAKVAHIEIRQIVPIDAGKYMCDVIYRVDTRNITGSVQAESHVKLIFAEIGGSLKAETMLTC